MQYTLHSMQITSKVSENQLIAQNKCITNHTDLKREPNYIRERNIKHIPLSDKLA